MDKQKLLETRQWVQEQLAVVADFWLKNGLDPVYGGVYTCLDRTGRIFSTDKSVWMQGRCGWTFAFLCKNYGIREEWLAASKSCLDFMEKYCLNREAGGRMYFTVTEDGQPLRQRRYCFSEAFYCMANAEYYGVTGEKEHLDRARWAYDLYWDLNHGMEDPVGMGPKTIPQTRSGRGMGGPMIFLNITSIMKRVDPEREALYNARAKDCFADILKYHVKKDLGCTLENVGPNGETRLNVTEGRIVNPGHDIECSWFMMDYANDIGDKALHAEAVEIFDMAFDKGWDAEYGGILYFIDCLGNPPEAYEHDMKLWWPHNEALIASLMIYRDTGKEEYLDIFYRLLDYCKTYFADEYGEWYGYLRRDGKPTQPACKGSTFKGPFHVPRCLVMLDNMLGELLEA
ncbi:MAG: AGE family epimerase/isomerase [Oscillospiraceae bacterium]|nr:AGE family epimerase/isomerase [Oscillospiraceae bacterium]